MSTANEENLMIEGGKVMSLLDHLSELRSRLFKSLVSVLVLFLISMAFSSQIINFLKGPLIGAMPDVTNILHFTGPLDVFLTSIKVSLLSSVVFSSPIWIFQFWKFIEPALYQNERRYILPFILISISLFLTGVLFCYYLILPIALEFLINLGKEVGTPMITIVDYISMIMVMIFGFGIVFEAPLILVLLAMLDLISAELLTKYRKFVIVGILFVGAVLTPPDPLSQIGMAIPLYFMYEISIIVIRFIKRPKAKETHV